MHRWCDRNILPAVAFAFIAGIAACRFFPSVLPRWLLFGLLVLLALAALLLSCKKQHRGLLLTLPLFFLLGNITMGQSLQIPLQPGHIAALIRERSLVSLVGTLDTMIEQDAERSKFVLNAQKIQRIGDNSSRQPVHGRVRLSMRGRLDGLQPGNTLMVLCSIGPITNFMTPGVFDYQAFMAARDIYVSGWISDRQHILLVEDTTTTPLQRIRYVPEQVRQKIGRFLDNHLKPDISGLYKALLIGSKSGLAPVVQEQFKATGTMHLLAISGLHMGLLGLLLGMILGGLLKRSERLMLRFHVPTLTLLATLPVLLGYAFIAGMNTPVFRALTMAIIALFAVLLRREHNMLHLVAAAALLVLALNPMVLFTASFQLSFSAVTALALYMPRVAEKILVSAPGRSRAQSLLLYGYTAFLVSVIATIGTLPFMLLHFHRLSSIGPVMNLLVEPLFCFWALPWGLVAVPFIFCAPDLAVILLNIGGYGLQAGQYLTLLGSRIPLASLWTVTPTPPEILFYGLLVILFSFKGLSGRQKTILAAGFLLLAVHFTWEIGFPRRPGASRISCLDVGQGQCTFLHLPDGSRILLDAGGNRGSSINIGERVIAPYLWKERIWQLDAAVISHPHSDHFNGMDFILQHFRPKKLFINGDERGEGNYSNILACAPRQGITVVVPTRGENIVRGKNFLLTVLGMNGLEERPKAAVNDRSLVLKYSTGKRAFLFPADISSRSERTLLAADSNLRADVLVAAHHGSATSNSKPFLRAVKPAIIVVSAGQSGQRHYPAREHLTAWQAQKIQTVVTRDQGTVTCSTNGSSLRCTPFARE